MTGRHAPRSDPLRRPLPRALHLAVAAAPGRLVGYLVLTLAGAVLPVVTAWLTRAVVDGIAHGAGARRVVEPAVGLAAAGMLAGVVPAGGRYLRNEIERAVGMLAKQRLFAAVNRITGLSRFEDPAFLDRLRLADESGGRGPNQVVDGAFGVVRTVVTVAGFLASLAAVSPVLATVVALSGIPVLASELLLSHQRARATWQVTPAERREMFYRNVLATEQAAKEVRLFGLGVFLCGRMLAERRAANVIRRRMDRRELAVQAALGLLAAAVAGAGLVWVVAAAGAGGLSVGDVAMFVVAVVGVQGARALVADEVARANQALLLFGHYVAVLDSGADAPVPGEPCPVRPLRHAIELRDVWFRYSDRHPWVLRGVDLTIPRGRTVALVGVNGAGKSTVVKLLCRFYDPTRGAVLWDGVDLREMPVEQLRERISAVFQDHVNYEMTAAENIGLGDLTALDDPARIEAAARRAGVDEAIVRLPQGYDTMLSRQFSTGPGHARSAPGVDLSGGQRQRIAVARAFVRQPRDLIILDEPSAGLDPLAEHEIHTRLKGERVGMTSLLVSHRLSAVRDADVIVTLSDGRVVEEGDHASLMAAGGAYAELFDLQAAGYTSTVSNPGRWR
jgi:ATP-binding cassette subfamily B protein